jgi:hypothetical protein
VFSLRKHYLRHINGGSLAVGRILCLWHPHRAAALPEKPRRASSSDVTDSDDDQAQTTRRVVVNLDGSVTGVTTSPSGTASPKRPAKLTTLGAPVFQGSFVEVDETLDDPTPSPRFMKSLKYSQSVISSGAGSPSPLAVKSSEMQRMASFHHNKGRIDGGTTPGTQHSTMALVLLTSRFTTLAGMRPCPHASAA